MRIFNILRHSDSIKIKIEKANVLDLYSGIGSFGIECISRGAENVTFIENNKDTSSILRENLLDLSMMTIAMGSCFSQRMDVWTAQAIEIYLGRMGT